MLKLALQFPEPELAAWFQKYEQSDSNNDAEVLACGERAAARGHLGRDEFLCIARWKSPRPTHHYETNSNDEIMEVTTRAFSIIGDVDKVLSLTALKGIKVRTATAILHVCFPKQYPILDFRAIAALGVKRTVTEQWGELDWLRIWPAYLACCRAIASRNKCDLRMVDRAMWVFGGGAAKPASTNAGSS